MASMRRATLQSLGLASEMVASVRCPALFLWARSDPSGASPGGSRTRDLNVRGANLETLESRDSSRERTKNGGEEPARLHPGAVNPVDPRGAAIRNPQGIAGSPNNN